MNICHQLPTGMRSKPPPSPLGEYNSGGRGGASNGSSTWEVDGGQRLHGMGEKLHDDGETEPMRPTSDDGLEDAIEEAGKPGFWLWFVFLMCSSTGVFNIWYLTVYVFQGAELPHWCDVPALRAANWTDEEIVRLSSVNGTEKSSCYYKELNYEDMAKLSFQEALNLTANVSAKILPCTGDFFYKDPETSIVNDWNLVCDKLALRSTAQMVVPLGKFIGAILFGFIADKWGRRKSVVASCVIYIIMGFVPAFSPWYSGFLAARLLLGMAGAGCYNCAFTLLTEVCNSKYRTMLGILYNMSYPVGMVLLAAIAYLERDWKQLQLWIAVPGLVLLLHCWFLPESPRWLMSRGNRKDAWAVVKRFNSSLGPKTELADMTGTNVPAKPDEEEESKFKAFVKSMQVLLSIFSNWELCKRLLICYVMWCFTALTYYALSLNADNFAADRYVYIAVSGVVEAISYLVPIPILKYVGRRMTSVIFYAASGVSLLVIMMIPRDQQMAIIVLAMIGRLAVSSVYSVMVLYTSELFPTVNRNIAIGTSSTMSHVGAIVAPYIVDLLGAYMWWIPSTLTAITCLLCGAVTIMLPETKDKPLCNTLEDVKECAKKGDKVTILNCCRCK